MIGGGKMRFKDTTHLMPRHQVSEYIDRVSYNGHALMQYMNREIEAEMRSLGEKDSKCTATI